jgi:hypothetical protein
LLLPREASKHQDIPSCAEFAGLSQEFDSAAPESVTKLEISLNGDVAETI